MSRKKEITTYTDYEIDTNFFVENAENQEIAYAELIKEYPEAEELYKPEDARLVNMSRCKDCNSWWVEDDGTCGECGESRLSERSKPAFYFAK